jgi:hypothetical protein
MPLAVASLETASEAPALFAGSQRVDFGRKSSNQFRHSLEQIGPTKERLADNVRMCASVAPFSDEMRGGL